MIQEEGKIKKTKKNEKNELKVRSYPIKTNEGKVENSKVGVEFPNCKERNWIEFDEGFFCKDWEFNNIKQKHQIDEKALREDRNFSTRPKNEEKYILFCDEYIVQSNIRSD